MATRRLYRSRNADLLGVCHGFAEWRDLPVSGVQLAVVLIALCTAVFPALMVYLIIGIILPVNPGDEDSSSNNTSYKNNRSFRAGKDDYETVDPIDREYEKMRRKARDAEESVNRTSTSEEIWEERFRRTDQDSK